MIYEMCYFILPIFFINIVNILYYTPSKDVSSITAVTRNIILHVRGDKIDLR